MNAFVDHPTEPTDAELSAVLGRARKLWDKLLTKSADVEIVERLAVTKLNR